MNTYESFTPENKQEEMKQKLWAILEGVIPDKEHELNEKLDFIKESYTLISPEDFKTELQDKEVLWTKSLPEEQCLFLKAQRSDEEPVYAVIGVDALVKYRADFFSPTYPEGHGGNHDFNRSELLENLHNAVVLPPYPTSK
jgi:hypothetical protein